MQKQKDEVRARIVDAATSEFTQYGYQKSSMRRIAQRAHITPGNIYAYFGGKQDLFDYIIGPTVQQLDDLIFSISKGKTISLPTIEQMTDAIAHIFLCNRTQFRILMQGSEGSPYEHIRSHVVDIAARRISDELMPYLSPGSDQSLLAETLAVSMVHGVFHILNRFEGDADTLHTVLRRFLILMLQDIDARM